MKLERKKRILVPIFNRAHYGRLRSVLRAIENHPDLELQIIIATQAAYGNFFTNVFHSKPRSWRLALPWYLRAKFLSLNQKSMRESDYLTRNVLADGFNVNSSVSIFLDGGASETMAKSTGLGIIRIVDELKRLDPDIVFVNADRFEMMAVAIAASYLNIPLAHNEGGDLSGTIDENIRHSITKLSHIHFTSTEQSRKRVIQMGESPDRVICVGSPAIDVVVELDLNKVKNDFGGVDINKPFIISLLHPVATESKKYNAEMANNMIKALKEINLPIIFLGSNIDAGSHEVGEEMRAWMNENPSSVYFTKHLQPDDFYGALAKASCLVGNSSSFIREGAYFGTPAVTIGSRQNNRERGNNLLEVGTTFEEIKDGIKKQIKHGRYKPDYCFGNGRAGDKIAEVLTKIKPSIQKEFYEA